MGIVLFTVGALAVIYALVSPLLSGDLPSFMDDISSPVCVMGLILMLGGLLLMQVSRHKKTAAQAPVEKAEAKEPEKEEVPAGTA